MPPCRGRRVWPIVCLYICIMGLSGDGFPLPSARSVTGAVASDDPPRGVWVALTGGRLYIPKRFVIRPEGAEVILHLHGAESVLAPAAEQLEPAPLVIAVNRNGLSRVYTDAFQKAETLDQLLTQTRNVFREREAHELKIQHLTVSSFSAGFGGVREMLKSPLATEKIQTLVLADSLYCGFERQENDKEKTKDASKAEGGRTRPRPDPELMAGFTRFAQKARTGKAVMLVTHSAQVPDGYSSTTETADDLIRTTQAASAPLPDPKRWDLADWRPKRQWIIGRFCVLGFSGDQPQDHMAHLRKILHLWRTARTLRGLPGVTTDRHLSGY